MNTDAKQKNMNLNIVLICILDVKKYSFINISNSKLMAYILKV